MKSFENFREYLIEQDVPEQKPPEKYTFPDSYALDPSMDPLDMAVIDAFFEGEPDVVGTNFQTKQNDDGDYTVNDLRIDLLWGRAKTGVVMWHEDIITFAEQGVTVDKHYGVEQLQSIVKNKARAKDIRTM